VRVLAAEASGSSVGRQKPGRRRRSVSQLSRRGVRSRDSVAQVGVRPADQASTPIEAAHSDEAQGTTRCCDTPDETHQDVDQGLSMNEQSDSNSPAEGPAEIRAQEDMVSSDGSEDGDSIEAEQSVREGILMLPQIPSLPNVVEVEFPNGQVAVVSADAAFVDTYGSRASGSDDGARLLERSSVGGAPSNADMPLTEAEELVNYMAETDNASELSSSASETSGASSTPSIPILPEVEVLVSQSTACGEHNSTLWFCIERILLGDITQIFTLPEVCQDQPCDHGYVAVLDAAERFEQLPASVSLTIVQPRHKWADGHLLLTPTSRCTRLKPLPRCTGQCGHTVLDYASSSNSKCLRQTVFIDEEIPDDAFGASSSAASSSPVSMYCEAASSEPEDESECSDRRGSVILDSSRSSRSDDRYDEQATDETGEGGETSGEDEESEEDEASEASGAEREDEATETTSEAAGTNEEQEESEVDGQRDANTNEAGRAGRYGPFTVLPCLHCHSRQDCEDPTTESPTTFATLLKIYLYTPSSSSSYEYRCWKCLYKNRIVMSKSIL